MSNVVVKSDFIKITELQKKLFQNSCSEEKETLTDAWHTFARFFDTTGRVRVRLGPPRYKVPAALLTARASGQPSHARGRSPPPPPTGGRVLLAARPGLPAALLGSVWSLKGGCRMRKWESRGEKTAIYMAPNFHTPSFPPPATATLSQGPLAQKSCSHLRQRDWSLGWGRYYLSRLRWWRNRIRLKAKASLSWNTIELISASDLMWRNPILWLCNMRVIREHAS